MMLKVIETPDLACCAPECTNRRPGHTDVTIAQMYARAAGWHAWTGDTLGGQRATVALCPTHARGGSVQHKPEPYDTPMFD